VLRFLRYHNKRKKSAKIEWVSAPDVEKRISSLVRGLQIDWVKKESIYSIRSENANTRAIARIWGLGRIWQIVLGIDPKYIIEVVSERFDRLDESEKHKVLLHEIAHIPKNFSGSLVAHTRKGKNSFKGKLDLLVAQYLRKTIK
jgi:predicted metallopeptidase